MDPTVVNLLQDGFAAQQRGDLAIAEQHYARVLARDSKNEFALNLLGVVCIRSGRVDQAIGYLQRALLANDSDAETHNNLGLAFVEQKEFAKARQCFERSLRLAPHQVETLNNLGNAFAAVDLHGEAIAAFESALKLEPTHVDCLCNLAESCKAIGLVDQALRAAEHAVALPSDSARACNVHGEVLLLTAQFDKARQAFQTAMALGDSIVAAINLSTAQKQLGEEQDAVTTLQGVLEQEPENCEAHNHLGVLYEQLGDTVAAARHFRLALAAAPHHASSYYQLAKLSDQRLSEAEISKIQALIADQRTLDIFRSSLYFALACEAEKDRDYDASMKYFIRAQAIKAARDPYDANAAEQSVRSAERGFPLRALSVGKEKGPVPLFVVGMPRSGTTLTEQILSSHSRIQGAGELGFMSELMRQASVLTNQKYPESIAALNDRQCQHLRTNYLDQLVDRVGSSDLIVDKNPLNFNQIGTIATLFPEARIVYCKREPLDNCVSIFRLPFDDNQGYSHDLKALGHYYRQHEKLMQYWLSCYSRQILTVQYEDTVNDLEAQARSMLEFVGVDFEPAVLTFFDNRRIVLTPSASQVRQPIYNDSIAAWKRYETHLGPLMESIGLSGSE